MQALYETVKEIIASGRIGTPVFARCLIQLKPEADDPARILARIMAIVCSWMKTWPSSVYVQRGRGLAEHISATIHFSGGQTAILGVSLINVINTKIDLMLLGNKGGVYHDSDGILPKYDINAEPLPVPDWMITAIQKSLKEGKPSELKEVAGCE